MKPKTVIATDKSSTNKKVYFGDDGVVVDKPDVTSTTEKQQKPDKSENVLPFISKEKKGFKKYQQNAKDIEMKWYQVHEKNNTSEFKEMKDSELSALQQLCKSSFSVEIQKLSKSKSYSSVTQRLL